jgi:hypothetical protein
MFMVDGWVENISFPCNGPLLNVFLHLRLVFSDPDYVLYYRCVTLPHSQILCILKKFRVCLVYLFCLLSVTQTV